MDVVSNCLILGPADVWIARWIFNKLDIRRSYVSQVSRYCTEMESITAEPVQLYYRRLPIVCGIRHSRKYRMSQFRWCCVPG